MEPAFWHQRWQEGQIGFHQQQVNPFLQKWLHKLALQQGDEVFVPLCGKSLDMLWLLQQGFRVIGVELSELALSDFARENQVDFVTEEDDLFKYYQHKDIQLLCGNFFDIPAKQLGEVKAVFDRASFIAFPQNMRKDYVEHMAKILPQNCRVLLITMEYPPAMIPGPPFSIPDEEVRRLFGKYFQIEQLQTEVNPPMGKRLTEQGDGKVVEKAWLLQKTGGTK